MVGCTIELLKSMTVINLLLVAVGDNVLDLVTKALHGSGA